jgi:hypothetical protein
MQPVNLPPSRCKIGKQRQHDVQGIEYDAPRFHFPGLGREARQHSAKIEVSRLHEIRVWLSVDEKQLLSPQLRELPVEAFCIGLNALRGFLKGDKYSRLLVMARTIDEELQ